MKIYNCSTLQIERIVGGYNKLKILHSENILSLTILDSWLFSNEILDGRLPFIF